MLVQVVQKNEKYEATVRQTDWSAPSYRPPTFVIPGFIRFILPPPPPPPRPAYGLRTSWTWSSSCHPFEGAAGGDDGPPRDDDEDPDRFRC
jgi:hypothetical protein